MQDTFHFTATLAESGNKLWGFHVLVPPVIARTLLDNDAKRVVCSLNEYTPFQCGLIPKGEQEYCIMVNKKLRDTLHLQTGSVVRVSLTKDESEYGLPVTEELREVLDQDAEGSLLFHALPPGKIRTLLYIAGQVKNSETRIFRALAIIDHLKVNGGKIDYKTLNVSVKEQ